MSSFSRSKRNQYVNPNYGSNHYQRKGGFLGNLFNMIGSNSGRNNYNNYPQQYPQQVPGQPMQSQPVQSPNFMMSMCTKCNANIPAGSKFCLECGAKVNTELFCLSCGEKLPGNAKFCLKCGTKVIG